MTYEFEVRTRHGAGRGKFTKTVEADKATSAWVEVVTQLYDSDILSVVVSLTLLGKAT